MSDDLKRRSIKGFAWAAGESVGVAAISLITFIVLARLLEPQDFGIFALASVFIFFCNLLIAHGLSDALVQRQDVDDEHFDTAFWSTLLLSLLLTGGCLLAAGPAAALLKEPGLAQVLPWLALSLPLGAASTVQMAIFRRDMRFDATLPDGRTHTVDGFMTIDDQKVQELPPETVMELHKNGLLSLFHAHWISMGNMRKLVDWYAHRSGSVANAVTQAQAAEAANAPQA